MYTRFGRLWLKTLILPKDVPTDVELCGVILGDKRNRLRWTGDELVMLDNLSKAPSVTYMIEIPHRLKRQMVSLFHTHPQGDERPSRHDFREARRLNVYGVIVAANGRASVHNGERTLGTFDVSEGNRE